MDDTLARVRERVAERFPADLERIRAYLRRPSVSATGEGIAAVAEARDLPEVGPAVVARGSANSKSCLACFFLTAEGAFDLDLTAGLDGQPELILGCKGLCDLELVCEAGDWGGPAIDLHSSEQAWIASPVWALVQALATLTGPDEEIRSAGLDGGPGPGRGDRRLLADLAGGHVGPGGKTIVPSRATARVDIRLVGGDPELAAAAVRRHLDAHAFGHVQVRLLDAYQWAKAEPGNRSAQAMRASYRALGRDALPYPLAPWCAPYFVFDRVLDLPWASGGVGHAAGAHGPDEDATLAGLEEHVVGAAAFLLAYTDLPR